jgi:hypothetical protein
LRLNDRSGAHRVRIAVAEDGSPFIELYDAEGTVVWSAP